MLTPAAELRKLLNAAALLLREHAARFNNFKQPKPTTSFEEALVEAGNETLRGARHKIANAVINIDRIHLRLRQTSRKGIKSPRKDAHTLLNTLVRFNKYLGGFTPANSSQAQDLSSTLLTLALYLETGEEEALLSACRQLFAAYEPGQDKLCGIWVRMLSVAPPEGTPSQEERKSSLEGLSRFAGLTLTVMFLSFTLTKSARKPT